QELDRLDETTGQVVEGEGALGLQFRGKRLALVRDLAEPASVFRWVELRIGFEATLVRTLDLFAEGQQFGLADFPDIVMAEPRLADTDDDLLEVIQPVPHVQEAERVERKLRVAVCEHLDALSSLEISNDEHPWTASSVVGRTALRLQRVAELIVLRAPRRDVNARLDEHIAG